MLALLREGARPDDFPQRWRVAALAYFHDITLKAAREVSETEIETDRDGLRIEIKGQGYWLPAAAPDLRDTTPYRANPTA